MKKAIMFLYIYFPFYSTFLLLYSWTDYEMIGLWAQTQPQPPPLITHLAALWFLFLPAWQREMAAFTTFIDILMLLSIIFQFLHFILLVGAIYQTVIVICDMYWQSATRGVQDRSVKFALCSLQLLKSFHQFERCFRDLFVLHLYVNFVFHAAYLTYSASCILFKWMPVTFPFASVCIASEVFWKSLEKIIWAQIPCVAGQHQPFFFFFLQLKGSPRPPNISCAFCFCGCRNWPVLSALQ